jgi:hypothetical protein
MSDKDLLELAAKAIGLKLEYNYLGGRNANQPWNPLTDDGDALRLAVGLKLFLDLEHCNAANSNQSVPVWFGGGEDENAGVSHDECDPCEATRRAIVRAAAEIGNSL